MTFKEKIYSRFLDLLNEKIDGFQFTLDELSESILNETKKREKPPFKKFK